MSYRDPKESVQLTLGSIMKPFEIEEWIRRGVHIYYPDGFNCYFPFKFGLRETIRLLDWEYRIVAVGTEEGGFAVHFGI